MQRCTPLRAGPARQMARGRIVDGWSIKRHFLGGGDLAAPRRKEEFRRRPPSPCCCRQPLPEVRRWRRGGAGWRGRIDYKFFFSLDRRSSSRLVKGLGREAAGPESTQERVGGRPAAEGEARGLGSRISRPVQFGVPRVLFSGVSAATP